MDINGYYKSTIRNLGRGKASVYILDGSESLDLWNILGVITLKVEGLHYRTLHELIRSPAPPPTHRPMTAAC